MADLIFPPSPSTGDEFTGTFGEVYTWDGEKWTLTAGTGGGGGASVTVSDTPPASPNSGDLWWDTVSGQLFIWYVDANSSQWVVANVSVGVPGPAGPPGPNVMPPGVTDGSNAAAGQVGEYLVTVVNGVTVTSQSVDVVATLALTPGDWDFAGQLVITPTGGPMNGVTGIVIQITGITLPWATNTNFTQYFSQPNGFLAGQGGACVPSFRVNISVATTVTITAGFLSTTATAGIVARADGYFGARRAR